MPSNSLGRRNLLGLFVAAAIGACGLTSIFKSPSAIRGDIQKEFGMDSNVGVNKINGKTIVNITLGGVPPGDPHTVEARIRAIVARHVPDATDVRISASMSLDSVGRGSG